MLHYSERELMDRTFQDITYPLDLNTDLEKTAATAEKRDQYLLAGETLFPCRWLDRLGAADGGVKPAA